MEVNYKMYMKTAILAGEILLSSGAETFRVEDTMIRILKKSGLETVETYVVLTGIVATLDDDSIEPITLVKGITSVNMNIHKIIVVNEISRAFCNGEITIEETYEKLRDYKWEKYNKKQYSLAVILIVLGFVMFFGGTVWDAVGTVAVGSVLALTMAGGKRMQLNGIIYNIINGAGIAFFAMIIHSCFVNINSEIVIISCLMPLVPGVPLTNGVRDILVGDYISGSSRIVQALLTAAGIAIGIGMGMILFGLL